MNVLITGASSGIGRALAEHYAVAGHTVGAVARRADVLEAFASEHEPVVPLVADVADGPAMERTIADFAREAGSLDLVIANAGVGQRTPEEGWDPARARLIAEVNVVGATNTLAPAARIMVEQGSGHLVGISSLAGQTPMPASAAYGASKAWLVFYLESLGFDLEPFGIRCTSVMPGYVRTAMVDGAGVGLLTPQARKAAELIATRVARGDRIVRFPAKVAVLARLSGLAPRSVRAGFQRRRLAKRQAQRGGRPVDAP